ncbi:hypothetical protein GOP47_0020779 [Adiantum capillus-veneris]|uniref:U6 snRNA phosphodiesterase 1 n=1 Tax=Adiantum capillus-veneris TaxID=13818 RepID=A0A9D4UBE2_ADICA|nr:hypothetical protein GOP47_0020779 [Adiantum capillus-veneris]
MEISNGRVVDAVGFHTPHGITHSADASWLPPPPPDLLTASNSSYMLQFTEANAGRIRSFPHVEGNYALHVFMPVPFSAIARRQLEPLMKKAFSIAPELKPMEMELLTSATVQTSDEVTLAKEYHISLSRTVPIRVHQINSIVDMLQNKFDCQKGFWLNLDQWELFVNDEQTRSFLSLEVVGKGLPEICRQIQVVDEVFRLHNLPAYYKAPRPHVSVAWALGNAIPSVQKAVEELKKNSEVTCHVPLCSHFVKKIQCKIGSRTYCIWIEKVQPKAPF